MRARDAALVHVTLVPYLKGWSYDLTAQALVRHLSHRFDFRIVHQDRLHGLSTKGTDLIVDFWWKGALDRKHGRRVLKQVSSHRWRQERYGTLDADRLVDHQLRRAAGILVPSKRLQDELAAVSPILCPKGFHPETFGDYDARRGDLVIGWAGASESSDKNVSMLVEAWPGIRLADKCLTQAEMPDFYNSIDVITCASDAEGDPRPLIEGMACGAFPVTVDVGIVPELVRHQENGLIVERTPQAFADAFAWCRANLDYVREAGRRNATEMLATRTWAQVSQAWGDAMEAAIAVAPPWRENLREERIARAAERQRILRRETPRLR